MSLLLSRLFEDGPTGQTETGLAERGRTDKGSHLFLADTPVRRMYLLQEGRMDLIRITGSGSRLMLFQAGPGSVLAEASAFSKRYHCDCIAQRASRWCAVPVATFHDRLAADPALASLWARTLAHALQRARMGSEIRTLRTVSERLDAWLAGGNTLPPKGERQDLAQTLGVSPEALYRELAKRR